MIETLILNVNMANTKQLSRPEMLPEPLEKQAPEQDFWSQTHICSTSNSLRKEPKKRFAFENKYLTVCTEGSRWINNWKLINIFKFMATWTE